MQSFFDWFFSGLVRNRDVARWSDAGVSVGADTDTDTGEGTAAG